MRFCPYVQPAPKVATGAYAPIAMKGDEIYLNLDVGQSGLGDMSYRPLDPYRYFPHPEKFILRIGVAVNSISSTARQKGVR